MKLQENAKRAAVFVYYDEDGVVDDYVPVLVGAVKKHCAYLLCVVNGVLRPQDEQKLAAVSDEMLFRPNEGLDITGYKEGYWRLRESGRLEAADELLFFNQTVFGPIYPFEETFDIMDSRDLDFWGMTRHRGMEIDPWGTIPYGYMPPHIQSYFFAVRRRMFDTDVFRRYWDEMPVFKSYREAVSLHEVCFTKRFADEGFCWDVYVDTEQLEPYNDYPLMGMPTQVVRRCRCPIVKRKSFLTGTTEIYTLPQGGAPAQLYAFLRDETAYDTALIAQNLTRTADVRQYTETMALIVPPQTEKAPAQAPGFAAVCCLTQAVLLPILLRQMEKAKEKVILCPTSELLVAAKQAAGAEVLCIRGEGLSALGAVAGRLQSEYLLYLSTQTQVASEQLKDLDLFVSAAESLFDVEGMLAFLQHDASVGMVLPLPNSHLDRVSRDVLWQNQRGTVQTLLKRAEIAAPLAPARAPVRMDGGFFACAAVVRALAKIDFDSLEQSPEDAAVQDYLPALCCQGEGLLCAFAAQAVSAGQRVLFLQNQLDDLTHVLATPSKRRMDEVRFRAQGIMDFYTERRYSMTLEQAFAARLGVKQKLWIILQLLMKPGTFEKFYRLTHGGRPMPTDHPVDELD